VIESSNTKQNDKDNSRIISNKEKKNEGNDFTNILRPKKIEDYVGQPLIKKHLMVSISSAKIRGESLDHILFYGPP
jgi:Holliday junction DNA helicase RuvB